MSEDQMKEYLNIQLPMPMFAFGQPLVLRADKEEVIMARVGHVHGKRDIQVLRGNGARWEFIGENGAEVTGQDGNFLLGAATTRDGRMWILARYTTPSNPMRGNSSFLYCLVGQRWEKVSGPDFRSAENVPTGLYVLSSSSQVACKLTEVRADEMRLSKIYAFTDQGWEIATGGHELQRRPGLWALNSRSTWFITAEMRERHRNRVIVAYELKEWLGHATRYQADEGIHAEEDMTLVDISESGRGALILRAPNGTFSVMLFNLNARDAKIAGIERVNMPPGSPVACAWSPVHKLIVCCLTGHDQLDLYSLEGSEWTHIVAYKSATAAIAFPTMSFWTDGTPFVVWEDFVPTD